MIASGGGYKFDFEILPVGCDLREMASVTALVDVAMLPKAIGGNAVSQDEEGNEDEGFSRGVGHPTISEFLRGLGGE